MRSLSAVDDDDDDDDDEYITIYELSSTRYYLNLILCYHCFYACFAVCCDTTNCNIYDICIHK